MQPLVSQPPPDRDAARFAAESRALLGSRLRVAASFFLLSGVAVSILELIYFPDRIESLLLVAVLYVAVCIGAVLATRLAPRHTTLIAVVGTNLLALCIIGYHVLVHNRAEMLVIALTLFLAGMAVLLPWRAREQAAGCLGAVLGYAVAVALGTPVSSPFPYSLAALLTASSLTVLSATLLERHRWTSFKREAQLREAERYSAALLEIAQALNATIGDPAALAAALVERARALIGADAAILYSAEDDARFRVAATMGLPPVIAAELRTLGFNEEAMGGFFRLLMREHSACVTDRAAQRILPPSLLARWGMGAFCSEVIERDGRAIGILACSWEAPRPSLEREVRLLAAIASQSAAALENSRLMDEARQANEVKSDFVATISHELRTPLNVIIGYTSLLREGALERPRERAQALERIHDQSLQLLELIKSMLTIHRIEAGEIPLHVEPFTLVELVADLRASMPVSWQRPGVALHWPAPDLALALHSDRGKMEIILRNLLHNALKYTDTGAVALAVQPTAGSAMLDFTVTDTGAGIAAEDLTRIFEMFRQGAASPPRDGGVGLGLYIVRRLVEALGGTVAVRSQPGRGSEFTVTVPRELHG